MKPVTGRPKNVAGIPPASVVVAAVLSMNARSVVLEPMPRVAAPAPVKVRRAQPFWNVEVTFTLVTLVEPRTADVVVPPAVVWAWPLRIDRTFDSQHREF